MPAKPAVVSSSCASFVLDRTFYDAIGGIFSRNPSHKLEMVLDIHEMWRRFAMNMSQDLAKMRLVGVREPLFEVKKLPCDVKMSLFGMQ